MAKNKVAPFFRTWCICTQYFFNTHHQQELTSRIPAAPTSTSRLGSIINQQRIKRETVRQNEVSDVAAADAQRLQLNWVFVLYSHLH